jgi:hypothetical protein
MTQQLPELVGKTIAQAEAQDENDEPGTPLLTLEFTDGQRLTVGPVGFLLFD